ncbi:OmpA/MotB family protein [Arcobacter sp. FWKO B]|uniref:OmpA/MotB family protein n=1 Tax=Arcobacter sp. FWKO B TaxID=2593672 RepID=UPI0018A423CC|nr:flagellar motor protein MotB [Arcobacter sp. FWKO B]QOG12013.1 OmpA family protein [Arcobacter sp. FWKO B]
MAKGKCPDCPKCLPGWLVQFGDLMSLLLVFFILLLSMAVMDKKKVEEYFTIMKKAMGFMDKTTSVDKQSEELSEGERSEKDPDESTSKDMEELTEEMEVVVQEFNQTSQQETEKVEMVKSQNEFILDVPTTLLFRDDEYELTSTEARAFVAKVARVVRTMPNTFNIEIIGHTDRSRYRSDQLPRDNWDISALRSISVVKELIKNRIDPAQLKVAAHASYKPKSDVASENRRVEMRFFSDRDQNDIFAKESFFDRLE